jgi:hypothetical protein
LAAGDKNLYCLEPRTGSIRWEYAHEGSGEYGSICLVPVPFGPDHVLLKHSDDSVKLIECGDSRSGTQASLAWETRSLKKSYAVPVFCGGHLFGFNGRNLTCVDPLTGEIVWRSRAPGDGFPIVVDGHLAIVCKSGGLNLISASRAGYRPVASTSVFQEDLVWTPPVLHGGAIFVRSFGEIARVDLSDGDTTVVDTGQPPPGVAGTRFEELLQELATLTDKGPRIDRFLKEAGPFPLTEPDGRAIFIYRGPGKELALGGDITGFGSKLKMHRVPSSDLFYCVVRLEADARVCYAFVRDFEAIPDQLNPNRVEMVGLDEDLELDIAMAMSGKGRQVSWMAMPNWKPPAHLLPIDKANRGRLIEKSFRSDALGKDVSVAVYLPAEYDNNQLRYPVAYIHDGQTARKLEIPLTLDHLIGTSVQPLIAVLIDERAPFMGLDNYAKMCGVELPQFIDQQFRTVPARDSRAHVGWGFGAMAAVQSALAHAQSNGKLAIQSPFILATSYVEPFMKRQSEFPLQVYIDWGKYDTRSPLEFWDVSQFGRQLTRYFRDHGYQPQGGQFNEGGDVPGWRNRTDDMLRALFPIQR